MHMTCLSKSEIFIEFSSICLRGVKGLKNFISFAIIGVWLSELKHFLNFLPMLKSCQIIMEKIKLRQFVYNVWLRWLVPVFCLTGCCQQLFECFAKYGEARTTTARRLNKIGVSKVLLLITICIKYSEWKIYDH